MLVTCILARITASRHCGVTGANGAVDRMVVPLSIIDTNAPLASCNSSVRASAHAWLKLATASL